MPEPKIIVLEEVAPSVLMRLAEETDYDNFKSAVARHQGQAGRAYEHALHEVWTVMYGLQD
jgi:hypothetical protein